jgi:hypothetical protein
VSLVDSDEEPDIIFTFKGLIARNKFEGKGQLTNELGSTKFLGTFKDGLFHQGVMQF